VPTISIFFGMVIEMFWVDHPPPHFHVGYQNYQAVVEIETGDLLQGKLPIGTHRVLRRWTERHRAELLANWDRAKLRVPLWPIQGADADD
jgi:hypothetical protein